MVEGRSEDKPESGPGSDAGARTRSGSGSAVDAGTRPGPGSDADAGTETPPVDVADGQSGKAAFVAALRVKRNAGWGIVVGTVFTVLVFVFFVVVPGTYRSPLWYVGLAFVLALSMAGLVAFFLTLGRAIRLSREL